MDENACACPVIKQGDAYCVPVELFLNGTKLTEADLPLLEEIEFTLGGCVSVRVDAAAGYSAALGAFLLPLTQEQTFALDAGQTELDVRVQWRDGNVLGIREMLKIKVADAASEEVL